MCPQLLFGLLFIVLFFYLYLCSLSFLAFHISFLSSPCVGTLWHFSLFFGALQSAPRGAIPLTPLQPPVREQFSHSGENDTAVFSPGDAHHQIPRDHQYVFYQRDDILARGETTRFCTHLQTLDLWCACVCSRDFVFSRKGGSVAFSIPS